MARVFVGAKNVDEDTYRKFKAMAIERGVKVGDALTEVMKEAVARRKTERARTKRLHYFDEIKPLSFGKGNENLSEEIDETLAEEIANAFYP